MSPCRAAVRVLACAGLLAPGGCLKRDPDFVDPDATDSADAGDDGTIADTSGDGGGDDATGASGDGGPTTGDDGADAGSGSGPTSGSTGDGGDGTSSGTGTGTGTGTTGPGCEMPMMECDGQCVDTQTDDRHCGMCGRRCHPVREMCSAGECVDKGATTGGLDPDG